MNSNKLIKMINAGEITVDSEFWVCCLYYRNVLHARPTRHVIPTLVRLENLRGPALSEAKKWGSSKTNLTRLVPVFPPRKALPIVGNVTDGDATLSAFETEEECVEAYQKMIEVVSAQIQKARVDTTTALDRAEQELEKYWKAKQL